MKTILLAEEDRGLASHWQSLIEQLGHRVIHECTVSGAIRALEESMVDLIITDILLESATSNADPQGGLKIISYIALNMTPLPQIIAISGAIGASAFVDRNFDRLDTMRALRKPVSDDDFIAAVKRSLDAQPAPITSSTDLSECNLPEEVAPTKQSNNQLEGLVQLLKATQFNLQRTQYSLDHAPDGVYWLDQASRLIYANNWNCSLLGYTRKELLSKTVSDIDPNIPNVDFFQDEILPKISKDSLQQETIHLRKDGTPITVETTLQRLEYDGEVIVCVYVRDISGRKADEADLLAAKAAVEESERRFRSLANSSSPLCWTTELDSTCSWLNARWLHYSGKSMEDQLGYGWLNTVHPDDRDRASSGYRSAFQQQEEFSLDYRLRRHDGEYRWFTVNATPRFDLNEKFVGYVGMSFDCHDAKLHLEQLEQSRNELALANSSRRAMLELLGTSDGVWDWTIGTADSEYTPGFRNILGFASDDLHALPNTLAAFDSRIHPDDHAGFWKSLMDSCEDRITFVHEYRIRDAKEHYLWVRTRGNASYDSNGHPIRFVGLTFDISDRKQAEIALAAERESLAQSNQDLSQFAYVASHDLQEPLRAVGGFLQLLELKCADQLDEQAKGYIQKSVDGAARMSQLINDLLLFSRVSRSESTIADVRLNSVVEAVAEEYDEVIARENVTLHVGQLPTITAARPLLMQLFRNLIGNSIKYRGTAPLHIEVSAAAKGADWLIRVQDNGIGVSPKHSERIFQLFARLHDREAYPGTGIGLAICKRVTERLRGEISIEENSKPGVCFLVRLPVGKRHSSAAASRPKDGDVRLSQ